MSSSKLGRYREKRDFGKTREPEGSSGVTRSPHLRFVVQKHEATRLHYDFRLEIDGVFHSWAVTRGPSLDPGEKRLAVEVEDHPLAYGDFEGTIPKGQYGGGTVMVWDRGLWAPTETKSPAAALADGELKFVLVGEKLKGDWVIVRMKHDRFGRDRSNWLLIKHRDDYARPGDGDGVLARDRSVASGRSMAQIAAGKGSAPTPFMRAGGRGFKADAQWSTKESADDGDPDPAAARTPTGARRSTLRETLKRTPGKQSVMTTGAIKSVRADGNRVLGVAISKPSKALWPAPDGYTKMDLAEYLATVAPWMLAHIAGRPCSLLRAPDGIAAETFFQRHAGGRMDEAVATVQVAGDRLPYLEIDDARGLVAMAQLAAIEFHPWNCMPGSPEVPGRLVFDLDPGPGVAFDSVVAAAKTIRQMIEGLGLAAFCKTTGGKGLHVVVPLKADRPQATWAQAKMFAETLCIEMARREPELYLTKMTKSARKGRIFLDYLRNDRMATAVAPLSPRARPGAHVSMPLTWAQVRAGLDPSRFTIKTAAKLMAKSSAWADYEDASGSLRAAIARLVGTAPAGKSK